MNDRVKAFLNKLINDERRWTSELEEEAREIVASLGVNEAAPVESEPKAE